ncbi:MAG: IPT/TIG domain-containing protein [bacterium]
MTRSRFKKVIVSLLATVFVGGLFWFFSGAVQAQTLDPSLGLDQVSSTIGLPSTDIRLVVARIIRVALGLLGIIAVILMIYAGAVWMTAGGNEERIGTAKKIMINGVIGLAIVLSSYAIVSFVINKLVEATVGYPAHCTNGIQDGDETDKDCGGSCPACKIVKPPVYPSSNSFYIATLPSGGPICIRNVHLGISFNKAVDLNTINTNTIKITDEYNKIATGTWKYSDSTFTTIEFVPYGDCGDGGVPDCLMASSTYILKIDKNNYKQIKTKDGKLSLECKLFSQGAGCGDVNFITGNNVDRNPPEILSFEIDAESPFMPGKLYIGDKLRARVKYKDDNGLQKINIYAGGTYLAVSKSLTGCHTTGTEELFFSTDGWQATKHKMEAVVFDWTMAKDSTSTEIILLEQCKTDSDCPKGVCINGKCVAKTTIMGVSPDPKIGGAVGTYVSISGYYFGDKIGKVYTKDKFGNWILAKLADCDLGSWTDNQIIIEITVGTATSTPFRVETNSSMQDTDKITYDQDDTNNNYGPPIADFKVNDIIRPGLCQADPAFGPVYQKVSLFGKNFGANVGEVWFGNERAVIYPALWKDISASTTVPGVLSQGAVAISLKHQNGYSSNGVRFDVLSGIDPSAPFIEGVSPTSGARGEYITITGKNFGANQGTGEIWFKRNGQGTQIKGSFDFPKDCQSVVWNDNKIIVKFPKTSSIVGDSDYTVQVKPDGTSSASPAYEYFYLKNQAEPRPGICKLSPASSPLPLPNAQEIELIGEYFGTNPSFYFSPDGSNQTPVANRLKLSSSYFKLSFKADGADVSTITQLPVNTNSGPVVVYKSQGNQTSDPAYFSVQSCVKDGSPDNSLCTVAGYSKCCGNGTCISPNDLCAGEKRWSAYIWRFSTKDIPKTPKVIEWCQYGDNSRLPSPSPNIKWRQPGIQIANDHQYNACLGALVTVEFNRMVNVVNIASAGDLVVNECAPADFDEDNKTCKKYQPVAMIDVKSKSDAQATPLESSKTGTATTSYIQLFPKAGVWKKDSWYQVVLKASSTGKTGISAGSGINKVFLAKDMACEVKDSAYCFWFKSGNQECILSKVIVLPYKYWTTVLEQPITGLSYSGHGLSSQRCIMMDVDGYDWQWSSANIKYADIYGKSQIRSGVQASSLANTVGILTADAVDIKATASTGTPLKSYTGQSPLTIDLTNPKVIGNWPDCLEACPNAEIGVQFNTTMSTFNLYNGLAVRLYECWDETCYTTNLVSSTAEFKNNTNNTIIVINRIIKNDKGFYEKIGLDPGSLYQVEISEINNDKNTIDHDPRLLWTVAELYSPISKSKPYNKKFIWRFKTKENLCEIDKVMVAPAKYDAKKLNDIMLYSAQPYSQGDSCDLDGQKLNAWKYNWSWSSSDQNVATTKAITTFGIGKYCNSDCLKKGSTLPKGSNYPICGNNKQEAGEDCDPPNKKLGCSLSCLFMGNSNSTTTTSTVPNGFCGDGHIESSKGEECDPGDPALKLGCSDTCLHIGSTPKDKVTKAGQSTCGNSWVGLGEDCEIGIESSSTLPVSSMNCTANCLHAGTKLSSRWCQDNIDLVDPLHPFAGFEANEYKLACNNSISLCRDGIYDMEEDPACEDKFNPDYTSCNEYCLRPHCTPNTEGCDDKGYNKGSSLYYSKPSFCGDGNHDIGEDEFCEKDNLFFKHYIVNPWALTTGVGKSKITSGDPPAQTTDITAVVETGKKGNGEFRIPCGYKSEAECKYLGSNMGLANNSCCYEKPNLVYVYPGTSTVPNYVEKDVCPNTNIEAMFDKLIDLASLPGNLIIARGIGANYSTTPNVAKDITEFKNISNVKVVGSYAYATGYDGLQIADVSDVLKAKVVGSIKINNIPYFTGFEIVGSYAYVTAGNLGLRIIDISDSTKPKEVASFVPSGIDYRNISIKGNYAYVIDAGKGLDIIDISDLSKLKVNNRLNGVYYYIDIYGQHAYITGGGNGLFIIDISDPTKAKVTGSINLGVNATFIDVVGGYAYISAAEKALRIVDVSDPTKPKAIGSYTPPGTPYTYYRGIEIKGNYAYVADGHYNLHIFDISDPAKPVIKETIKTNQTSNRGLAVSGNYVFVSSYGALIIVDIAKYTLNCEGDNDVTALLAQAQAGDQNSDPWYERLWKKVKNFFAKAFGGMATAANDEPIKWCAGLDSGTAVITSSSISNLSNIKVNLDKVLALDTHYAVILKEDISDVKGVKIGKNPGTNKNWYWRFKTDSKICTVDKTLVNPSEVYLDKYGATSSLMAQAVSGDSNKGYKKIQPIKKQYYWEYEWNPYNIYVAFDKPTTTENEGNIITAQNHNGEIDLRVQAIVSEDIFNYKIGPQGILGKSHVIVLLCSNPWPPKDLYIGTKGPYIIFPYKDDFENNDHFDWTALSFDNKISEPSPFGGYFNFSTYYCADAGGMSKSDDLPYLRPAVQVDKDLLSSITTLKRFLFTSDKNLSDVAGIQIFANKKHSTLAEWYQDAMDSPATGLSSTKIDGYPAITDGNNIYVDVLNYYGSPTNTLYSNIYLFSLASGATTEMQNIFKQLISNLKFNTNLSNFQFCSKKVDSEMTSKVCKDDFDCNMLAGEFCSAQVDKLKRNFQRLNDLYEIESDIYNYGSAPLLDSGTLLKNQTISTWSSWSEKLAKDMGVTLPVDPINKLGKAGTCIDDHNKFCLQDSDCKKTSTSTCSFHDATTGWSTEKIENSHDRRLSFACNTTSLAYRYFATSSDYQIRARLEDPFGNNIADLDKNIVNWKKDFVYYYTTNVLFEPSGICTQNEEIRTDNNGVCGDGQVNNTNEQCEPPGKTDYTPKDIKDKCTATTPNLDYNVCDKNCQWSKATMSCSKFAECNNGIVEFGEDCDFGKGKNGEYNVFCDTNCKEDLSPSKGSCGDGILQLKNEYCDYDITGYSLYAKNKKDSCNSDCTKFGEYCGDGVVQTAHEKCEPNQNQSCKVKVNGVELTGEQECKISCDGWEECTTTAKTLSQKLPKCGDKIIDASTGEQCDFGDPDLVEGGLNGKGCTPKYGESCLKCTTECKKEWEDIKEWCGNGKIEGPEVCEKDSSGNIYVANEKVSGAGLIDLYINANNGYKLKTCSAEAVGDNTYQKGKKDCAVDCSYVTNDCVKCGIDDKNGVPVQGEIINVLDPKSKNPLWGGIKDPTPKYFVNDMFFYDKNQPGQDGTVVLDMSTKHIACSSWTKNSSSTFVLYKQSGGCYAREEKAYINREAICSAEPNPYIMIINNDKKRSRSFSLYSNMAIKNEPWKYDMVLSPVIPLNKPTNAIPAGAPVANADHLAKKWHIRVVTSWVNGPEFISGAAISSKNISTVLNPVSTDPVFNEYVGSSFNITTGTDYYKTTEKVADRAWYHGYGKTTNETKVESFTLNLNDTLVPITSNGQERKSNYAFFVKLPKSIKSGIHEVDSLQSGLKVDVYLPETINGGEWDYYRHFAKPYRTYYLSLAEASINSTAHYWHVFNVKSGGTQASASNIVEVGVKKHGQILTKLDNLEYDLQK